MNIHAAAAAMFEWKFAVIILFIMFFRMLIFFMMIRIMLVKKIEEVFCILMLVSVMVEMREQSWHLDQLFRKRIIARDLQ